MCTKDRHHDFDETEMMNLLINRARLEKRKKENVMESPPNFNELEEKKISREDKGMEMEQEL